MVFCCTQDISEDVRVTAHRCHGEKHVQVITKQREALREMRQRMKKIEHWKPPCEYTNLGFCQCHARKPADLAT